MSSSQKLRVLLIRDFLCFVLVTTYFFIPGDYGLFIALAGVLLVERVANKKLKGAARLELPQKKTYLIVSELFLLVWVLLILRWVHWHFVPLAIAIGALAIIVLLAYSFYVYETTYGKSAEV
jgi:hypothetical protein